MDGKDMGRPQSRCLNAFKNGTVFNIHMRDNGLIYADAPGKALTWMDAVVNGILSPPGEDMQLRSMHSGIMQFVFHWKWQGSVKDKKFIKEYEYLPELIKKSFIELFWDEKLDYLADYVNDEEGTKYFCQAEHGHCCINALFHAGQGTDEESSGCRGQRACYHPEDSELFHLVIIYYRGACKGNQEERDKAYHQGTVWPWLYGPFCEGWLRVYGNRELKKVRNLIFGLEDVMSEHGVSTLSEIHDGDPPHSPQGAISQAWSVGEVLRIIDLLETKYANY